MQRALRGCFLHRPFLSTVTANRRISSHLLLAPPSLHRSFATTASVGGIPTITVPDAQKEIKEVRCRRTPLPAAGECSFNVVRSPLLNLSA